MWAVFILFPEAFLSVCKIGRHREPDLSCVLSQVSSVHRPKISPVSSVHWQRSWFLKHSEVLASSEGLGSLARSGFRAQGVVFLDWVVHSLVSGVHRPSDTGYPKPSEVIAQSDCIGSLASSGSREQYLLIRVVHSLVSGVQWPSHGSRRLSKSLHNRKASGARLDQVSLVQWVVLTDSGVKSLVNRFNWSSVQWFPKPLFATIGRLDQAPRL